MDVTQNWVFLFWLSIIILFLPFSFFFFLKCQLKWIFFIANVKRKFIVQRKRKVLYIVWNTPNRYDITRYWHLLYYKHVKLVVQTDIIKKPITCKIKLFQKIPRMLCLIIWKRLIWISLQNRFKLFVHWKHLHLYIH